MSSLHERSSLLFKAEIAEKTERYDEMVDFMKHVVRLGGELSVEERSAFSKAYKSAVGNRRASWRILSALSQKKQKNGDVEEANRIKKYMRERVESEIEGICNDVIAVINEVLLPGSEGAAYVFYNKMKGDYYRYLGEIKTGDEKNGFTEHSLKAYQAGMNTAMTDLPPTHPTRLGLAMNFSVFYYEIMNKQESAYALAEGAFDEAIEEMDKASGESFVESVSILQLLRDNLRLWTSDNIVEEA